MRILITSNTVPFIHGGADYHIEGLYQALREFGHQVEQIRFPFKFSPDEDLLNLMDFCAQQNLTCPNGQMVDKLISLQFPAYGVQHPNHVAWVMHQHRAVYDLFPEQPTAAQQAMKDKITAYDNQVLAAVQKLYANSKCVAERLQKFNQLTAQPLYHPPNGWQNFYHREAEDYVFYPSRLESLNRQDLLIKAAALLQTPVKIIIGGIGGQMDNYQQLIETLGVGDRVRLIGRFSEAEKYAYYAHSLGVFFGPKDEDYGYITLESMLAAKPVITCTDSGGPLEFVQDQQTGFVVEPEAQQVADAIDKLYMHKQRSKDMGAAGKAAYNAANISWRNVAEQLLG